MNHLGLIHRSECLRWLPTSSFENSETVISADCHHLETVCYVGRLISSTNILPGKYLRELDKVGTVFNGDEVTHIDFSSINEILDVRPGCQLTWMPFSAGDAIPTGAVEGGFLESNGATLYVIRAPAGPRTAIFGYYDPASNSGYVPHFGPVLVIEMELLVLLWTVTHLTHLPMDQTATISQIFLDAFPWMKSFVYWRLHWSLFQRVQFTIIQHWFR